MSYQHDRRYAGELSQLFEVKEYEYTGGRAEGVRAVDIRNRAGVELQVLPGRCMDFGRFSYKGHSFQFITPAGMVNTKYYDNRGVEFLRSFNGGMLTTCGLTEIGSGGECNGEQLGLHGRIANTPAEHFSCTVDTDGGAPSAELRGTMRQAVLFGERLTLTRKVTMGYDQKGFCFTDTVENTGFLPSPFMLLYHFNLGYPLVDEDARIYLPASDTQPRTPHAAEGRDRWDVCEAPQNGYEEMCYLHTLKADKNGRSAAALYNHRTGLGLVIRFDRLLLDRFVEWKQMGEGDYVIGLEPTNGFVDGRLAAMQTNCLKHLEAGEKHSYTFELQILEGQAELDALLHAYAEMK